MIADRVPGFDILQLLRLTDRQIFASYFPEMVLTVKTPTAGFTYREAFWKIGTGRGWTESQIRAEWHKQQNP